MESSAIYDVDKDEYFVARDHMGIIPLYIGWDQHGTLCFRTESIRRILYKNTTLSSWTLYDK
jgi:asparagine synthetase B (glutamine-hydrolysing)